MLGQINLLLAVHDGVVPMCGTSGFIWHHWSSRTVRGWRADIKVLSASLVIWLNMYVEQKTIYSWDVMPAVILNNNFCFWERRAVIWLTLIWKITSISKDNTINNSLMLWILLSSRYMFTDTTAFFWKFLYLSLLTLLYLNITHYI